jgi:hypothetical protein
MNQSAATRILMLSIVNPVVERNGASTVTRGLIKLLESSLPGAAVDLIPARPSPLRWHRLAQARSLLTSAFSPLPAKAAFLFSTELRDKVVARVQSARYDLVILNGTDLLWLADYLPDSLPRILVAHNIEHLLFGSQIQSLHWRYRPIRAMLRNDCRRLRDYEFDGIRKSRNVIFLSHEDGQYAAAFCPGLNATTIPPVFDYEPRSKPPRQKGPTLEIGFLGNFSWWPNQLGLRWFAGEVFPYLKSPVRLHLFGQSDHQSRHSHPGIVEHGVVEDIEKIWASCHLFICPAFATGGVCVKFAEAVYNRLPVLSTVQGARGLPAGDDPAIVFLNHPREWIEFLNSTAAWDLAHRQVSENRAAVFAVDTQTATLRKFLRNLISSTKMVSSHGVAGRV